MKTSLKTVLLTLSLCLFCACESESGNAAPVKTEGPLPGNVSVNEPPQVKKLAALRSRAENYKLLLEKYESCISYQELSWCKSIADQLNGQRL